MVQTDLLEFVVLAQAVNVTATRADELRVSPACGSTAYSNKELLVFVLVVGREEPRNRETERMVDSPGAEVSALTTPAKAMKPREMIDFNILI
jgi:hypothetical protein